MKWDHFAFWLQGYFEIAGKDPWKCISCSTEANLDWFSDAQIECIKNHIELVKSCLKKGEEIKPFLSWLEGTISTYHRLDDTNKSEVIKEFREKLNNLFEHEIDPKMGKNTEELKKIHEGRGKSLERRSSSDIRFMC